MRRDFASGAARRIVLDLPGDCPDAPSHPADNLLAVDPDAPTTLYVLACQAPFNRLRQTASQYAGLLLLAAIGGNEVRDLPMLDLARRAVGAAADAVRALPVTVQAAHHHRHMLQAVRLLEATAEVDWSALGRQPEIGQRLRLCLNAAIAELRWASLALPGFELTSMSGCCAAHSPQHGQ